MLQPNLTLLVSDYALLPRVQPAWASFERAVPDHPLQSWQFVAPKFSGLKARHIAEGSVLFATRSRGNTGFIRFHEDFFALPAARQTLTLLHEVIHVALFAGECAEWYAESQALDREFCQHPFESKPDRTLVNPRAWAAALYLFQLKHEIAAEKFLQANYPNLGLARAEYYLEMQEEHWLDRDDQTLPTELMPFGLLFRLSCAELSVALAAGRLAERPLRLRDQYRAELMASSRPELNDRLQDLVAVDVNPARANLKAYRAIFDDALKAKPPTRSDWPDWNEWPDGEGPRG